MKDGESQPKESTVERYVGCPGMRSVVEHILQGLSVNFQTTIKKIDCDSKNFWHLHDANNNVHGPFDRLLVATPAPQAVGLLQTIEDESKCASLLQSIKPIQMNPSWATMVRLESPLSSEIPWSGAFVHDSLLSWVARDGSKPQRNAGAGEQLVLHATADWSTANLERDAEEIATEMLAEFWRVSGCGVQEPTHLQAHRWRHAIPVEPAPERTIFTDDLSIGCCGDWLGGPRVEGAFLSGMAAAGRILGSLSAYESDEDQAKQRQLFG